MDTITPLPNRKTIEAEACAWIAQLDGSNPSQQDLAALREWMNRSPAHREAIQQLSALWDDLNIFTELAVPRPSRSQSRRKGFFSGLFRRVSTPIPAAALTLVLVAVALATWQLRGTGIPTAGDSTTASTAEIPAHADSYVTRIGEQRTVRLADGSRMTLNTDTRVEVDLHAEGRDIHLLKGEALFEVAHDPARPFRVYAGNGLVRAIGTAFTVYLKAPDNVSVTVAEGEVELATIVTPETGSRQVNATETRPIRLASIRAGQIATFGRDIESIETLEPLEISRQLSWHEGMLHFDGEPLSQAVHEVSRYTTQQIVILDPALRDLRIGGYFKVGETEAMFEALEASFGVRVERINENLVHLSARR